MSPDRGDDAAPGFAMTPEEGCEALRRILSRDPISQVVVSTGDLHARVEQWLGMTPPAEAEAGPQAPALEGRHPRPELLSDYAAPRDEIERAIGEAWQDLLGVERVGIHDNFFELGGHSLLAIQLTARLRQRFRVDVSIRSLFDAPTIAELAQAIHQAERPADESEKIIRVLERVERLSQEEMQALLAAHRDPTGREAHGAQGGNDR